MMKLLQHFKELTVRPKNAQELKGLILQLAIQGKLTSNWRKGNPDIENASILLERIKTEKGLHVIKENEIPFELNPTWKWSKLVDVAELRHGHQFRNYDFVDEGIPVIKIGQCKSDGTLDFSKCNYIDSSRKDEFENDLIFQGHLLMALTGGTLGKVTRVDKDYGILVQNYRVGNFFADERVLSLDFLNVILESELFQGLVRERINQNAQPNIGKDNIEKIVLPIPPLEEQKAIVEVVETLFKEVEQLEQLTVKRISLKEDFVTSALNHLTTNNTKKEWAFLQDHFHSFFNETTNIKKLRETVLQLAVQGRLTANWREQRTLSGAEAEDASILLKRIQEEKAQLIKDGKIKKEKPLPPLVKDEIPYELPQGWVWCRLGDILLSTDAGKSPSCEKRPVEKDEWGVLTTTSIQKGYFLQSENKVLPSSFEINHSMHVKEGDVLITRAGPLNRTGIVCRVKDLSYNLILSDKTVRLKHFADNVNGDFLVVILNSSIIRELLVAMMSGMASSQVNISQGNIKLSMIPIPPLEEQKAIVEKVNTLMGLCDALEQEVQQSQKHSEQLMQSCLREVFEGKKEVCV